MSLETLRGGRRGRIQQKCASLTSQRPDAHDLATIVDRHCTREHPAAVVRNKVIQVAHHASVPDKRMLRTGSTGTPANDLARVLRRPLRLINVVQVSRSTWCLASLT